MSQNGERDIVVGNVEQFDTRGFYTSGLHKNIFKENIENTHIIKYPELIYDTTVWNKLFNWTSGKKMILNFQKGLYMKISL